MAVPDPLYVTVVRNMKTALCKEFTVRGSRSLDPLRPDKGCQLRTEFIRIRNIHTAPPVSPFILMVSKATREPKWFIVQQGSAQYWLADGPGLRSFYRRRPAADTLRPDQGPSAGGGAKCGGSWLHQRCLRPPVPCHTRTIPRGHSRTRRPETRVTTSRLVTNCTKYVSEF